MLGIQVSKYIYENFIKHLLGGNHGSLRRYSMKIYREIYVCNIDSYRQDS